MHIRTRERPAREMLADQEPVLVVDDHRVVTDALRLSLERQEDVSGVTVAHSAGEALARARRTAFDAADWSPTPTAFTAATLNV